MRKPVRSWMYVVAGAAVAIAPVAATSGTASQAATRMVTHTAAVKHANMNQHMHINCSTAAAMCTEVANSDKVFGHYVGHDEPSLAFYSHKAGSGNHMSYNVTLPVEPPASNPNNVNKAFSFELSGADWFGMAMCDTQSYPEQIKTCTPDSDSNILNPATSPRHAGTAFMEMQFYPPGWIQWPTWRTAVGASSCDPTRWCAALNIDSLSLNPVTNQANNAGCLAKAGLEYLNFAFITKNGKSTGPANPIDSTLATFTPSRPGPVHEPGRPPEGGLRRHHERREGHHQRPDHRPERVHDGQQGQRLRAGGVRPQRHVLQRHPVQLPPDVQDVVHEDPGAPGPSHGFNVGFDSEIGHFQFCTGPKPIPATEFGLLPNGSPTVCPKGDNEGRGLNATPADGDDAFCFPAKRGTGIQSGGLHLHQHRVRRRLVPAALGERQHHDAPRRRSSSAARQQAGNNTVRRCSKPTCRRSKVPVTLSPATVAR